MKPLRISVIGIDGSGKSTTTLRAIHSLSHQIAIKSGLLIEGDLSDRERLRQTF